MKDHDLLVQIREHLESFPERQKEIHEMRSVLFGNPLTGDVGMKRKVDEIHEILVQAKGLKGVLYILIAIGGAAAVVKGFLIR